MLYLAEARGQGWPLWKHSDCQNCAEVGGDCEKDRFEFRKPEFKRDQSSASWISEMASALWLPQVRVPSTKYLPSSELKAA